MQFAIPRSKYKDDPAVAAFCARIVERVAALPGVASAGMVNRLPMAGTGQINLLHFETADPDTWQMLYDELVDSVSFHAAEEERPAPRGTRACPTGRGSSGSGR